MEEVIQAKFVIYLNGYTRGGGLYTDIKDGVKTFTRDGVDIARAENKRYFILKEMT